MSGGVDSTYTGRLLSDMGLKVEGAVLKMSEHTDIDLARESAEDIGVPLHVVDCTQTFRDSVIANLISEYTAGRTPNPCVMCNRYVKIALLCETARSLGLSYIATGHYAAVMREGGRYYVERAQDLRKDQSYVLWQLTQEQLSMLYTPLCGLTKDEIKKRAASLGIHAVNRPESQEICFIPDKDYAKYIENTAGKFPDGNFIDENGNVVGRHKGIVHYTIGQRKGLGLSMNRHVFVTDIDARANTVTVASEDKIFSAEADVAALNFQYLDESRTSDGKSLHCEVKIRYGAALQGATVTFSGGSAHIVFDEPARAVTPGQSAVFYDGGRLLFGGFFR